MMKRTFFRLAMVACLIATSGAFGEGWADMNGRNGRGQLVGVVPSFVDKPGQPAEDPFGRFNIYVWSASNPGENYQVFENEPCLLAFDEASSRPKHFECGQDAKSPLRGVKYVATANPDPEDCSYAVAFVCVSGCESPDVPKRVEQGFWECETAPSVATSHCAENELTYYNCTIEQSANIASVCGPPPGPGAEPPAYLQYRFGQLGVPEFVFPASMRAGESNNVFHFENQRTRDGSTQDYYLWFRSEQWIHEVYYREEFENCTEGRCSPERTGQAAFVSAWPSRQAWQEGDESKGTRFRCTNPEDNEPFKGIEDFASRLSGDDTKHRIFGEASGGRD